MMLSLKTSGLFLIKYKCLMYLLTRFLCVSILMQSWSAPDVKDAFNDLVAAVHELCSCNGKALAPWYIVGLFSSQNLDSRKDLFPPNSWCPLTFPASQLLFLLIWAFDYLLKGLLPCMCPDMIVECRSTSKGTAAIATLERSVTGMGDYVVP